MKRIKNIIKLVKSWNEETLEAIRYGMFVVIAVDLFGIYWYFNLKKLGIAILLVTMSWLAIILICERRLSENKMSNENEIKELRERADKLEAEDKKDKPKEDKKDEPEESVEDALGSGLPDADEYNKRAAEALGTNSF